MFSLPFNTSNLKISISQDPHFNSRSKHNFNAIALQMSSFNTKCALHDQFKHKCEGLGKISIFLLRGGIHKFQNAAWDKIYAQISVYAATWNSRD